MSRIVLAGYYPPPFAGEPIHVRQLAGLLRARGVEAEVVNLNRRALPSQEYRSGRGHLAILTVLIQALRRTALLHLHTNGHSWKSWALILRVGVVAKLRGVPAILTIHSGLFPGYVWSMGPTGRTLARWLLAPFDRIVAVNQEIGAAFRKMGVTEGRVHIIPAFLGVPEAPDLSDADRATTEKFQPLLVAVGGGEKDAELGLLVVVRGLQDLLPMFPGIGAVFIGWQVGPKVSQLVHEHGLEGHAVCLGQVSHERCLALLRAADVVVRSTFADGDAITVREALALGVPVVASDTPFRPEGTVLFRKGDARDFVAKLTEVLTRGCRLATEAGPDATVSNGNELWRLYCEVGGVGAP